jgi:diguanylate cyclase (GGDEF)-like protein
MDNRNRVDNRAAVESAVVFVRATRKSLRAADVLFRYANDRFVAVLLQTSATTAATIATRISESVKDEQSVFDWIVQVSIVSAPENGRTLDELLEHAHRDLQRVRGDGKNTNQGPTPSTSIH